MKEAVKIIREALTEKIVNKIIFSRPRSKEIKKSQGRIVEIRGIRYLQLESFYTDGKARQINLPEDPGIERLDILLSEYRQINLFTTGGECEILISKNGKVHINDRINHSFAPTAKATANNKERHYLLDPIKSAGFLSKLGVCSESGEIYDKKRSKFKQINRFVEILDDIYGALPKEGPLRVCDLCCGKSYLTFAVYYYLTVLKGRIVIMYGVDLKKDVIDFCKETAKELDFDGMLFECGNIFDFDPKEKIHLVISLHACDIATDIVLSNAVRLDADVILSTPCCHHEMMKQLDCSELSFVSEHSMFRQKMCDALTDALRCKRLEAEGYRVTAIELIDPEETPKNIMIRAVKGHVSEEKKAAALAEYQAAATFLKVDPYLNKLLQGDTLQ